MGSYSLIPVLVILVIFSGFFSATETAFSTVNPSRLKAMASDGSKRAARTLELVEAPDRLLSTILIGNNIVNITAASLATLLFADLFAHHAIAWSTVIMTAVILIFGEITPKHLAKTFPEHYSMFSASILRFFRLLFSPLNFIFSLWLKLLSRIFTSVEDSRVTEDEVLDIVDEAMEAGTFDEQESELIRSAIEFDDLEVQDILTPRVQIEATALEDGRPAAEKLFRSSRFSRLPVFEETIDNVVGIIYEKDFFQNPGKSLKQLLKPAHFVAPNTKISGLLRYLQQNKAHMAFVVDEFGGTQGLVTLEDILEQLVGEIWDEHDEVIEEIKQLGEYSYRILCSTDLAKLFELFEMEEIESDNATVSGWVMEALGRVPEVGDRFEYENLSVEVLKTDERHAIEIQVEYHPSEESEEKDD
ncbi:MAG: HlyC/CorC family transporter [Ruminococcaceae bacterium]|nr:HlyC/CorC family transporter [Oscillospiraceae bacterium]